MILRTTIVDLSARYRPRTKNQRRKEGNSGKAYSLCTYPSTLHILDIAVFVVELHMISMFSEALSICQIPKLRTPDSSFFNLLISLFSVSCK